MGVFREAKMEKVEMPAALPEAIGGYGGNALVLRRGGGAKLPAMAGLSDRHRTFITVYLKGGNASEAARQAGFNWPGQKGAKLLKTAKIRAAICAELKPYLPLRRAHVMAALAQLACSNLGFILDEQGQPSVEKIREHGFCVKKYRARVIRSLSTDEIKVTDVYAEMYDRLKALTTIGKILGLFSTDSKVTQAKNDFFEALDEALVRFVLPENRVPMTTFLRERLDHHASRY